MGRNFHYEESSNFGSIESRQNWRSQPTLKLKSLTVATGTSSSPTACLSCFYISAWRRTNWEIFITPYYDTFFQPYIISFNLGNLFYWFWIKKGFFSQLNRLSFKVFSVAAISWLNSSAFSCCVAIYILFTSRNTIFPLILTGVLNEGKPDIWNFHFNL